MQGGEYGIAGKAEKKERPGAEAKAGQVKAEISPRISEIMGEVKKVEKG